MRLLKFVASIIWLCIASLEIASAQDVAIEGIRFGGDDSSTRLVLDVSKKTQPRIFLLADPYRIVVDLPETDWRANEKVKTVGVIDGFRHGLFAPGVYRIVFDLKAPAVIKNSFHLPPSGRYGHRFVVDLASAGRADFLTAVRASKKARPVVVSQATPDIVSPKRRTTGKRIIVLDPGHGGPDPGNLGVIGVHEKVITLKIARAVRDELLKTGRYDVRMTRDRDIFHKVRERFRIARRHHADLFISIHADSIKNKKVQGASVYNLSEKASDSEAARLAARENKSDLIAGVNLEVVEDEVSGILIDLAQRETMNYSAQFAAILVAELSRDVPMLRRAHRFANLGMLKAPDVPSVLLEAGYLTNKANARFLNSKDGQRRIAKGVRRAVDRYFEQMVAMGR